tara:strand:- start:49565 stop:49981 length:417 start_codon:yes stop_codon:yes gene_type:complete
MARNFHRKNRLSALSELNVTPLIDLAFSLLIIFMISAPLLEQTIPLELPSESQNAPKSAEEEQYQVVSIDRSGQVFWGEEEISIDLLDDFLQSLALHADPPIIHLRADASLPYQHVVTVLDKIKQNQLSKISLDTQVE